MTCPKCQAEMQHIGLWPDYSDHDKLKETYVCSKCKEHPYQGMETVRVEREAVTP